MWYILLMTWWWVPVFCFGQELLGLGMSNYGGTNNIPVNPAMMLGSKLKGDANLITFGMFLENNYVYVPNTNLPHFIRRVNNGDELVVMNELKREFGTSTSDFWLLDKFNTRGKSVYFNTTFRGPAVRVALKQHAFALHTAWRTVLSGNRIHYSIAKLGFEGWGYRPLHGIDYTVNPFRINLMSWGEFGASYAYSFQDDDNTLLTVGITLKYLHGYAGAYFRNHTSTYMRPDAPTFIFYNLNISYGYTDPEGYVMDEGYRGIIRGKGAGMELGMLYGIKYTDDDKGDYYLKLGASLIDIGWITFNRNAKEFSIRNGSTTWYNINSEQYADINDFDTTASNRFFNEPGQTFTDNRFSMWLPSALSVQADYRLGAYTYVSGLWVQRIPHSGPGVDRANLLAITPRFETRYFEVAAPLVFYQYIYPRVGLFARLAFIGMGSDNILSIVSKRDFSGFDFYFTIRVFDFLGIKKKDNGDSKGGRSQIGRKIKRPSGRPIPCPSISPLRSR